MKTRIALSLTILLLVLAVLLIIRRQDPTTEPQHPSPAPAAAAPVVNDAPQSAPPIGDQHIEGYADPATTPLQDLQKVGNVADGMLLLFKNLDTRLVSSNGELAAFLRGNNPEKLVFLSSESSVFGPGGELIDRWGSPYFIHPVGTGLIGVRSAGPDRILFTDDDLSRLPDGSIQRGDLKAR